MAFQSKYTGAKIEELLDFLVAKKNSIENLSDPVKLNIGVYVGTSEYKLKDLAVDSNIQQIITECNKEYPNFINSPSNPGVIVGCFKNNGRTSIKGIHIKLIGYNPSDYNRVRSIFIEEDSNGYTEESLVLVIDPVVPLNIQDFLDRKTYTFEEFFNPNFKYLNSLLLVGVENIIFRTKIDYEYKFTMSYNKDNLISFTGIFGLPNYFYIFVSIKININEKTVSTEVRQIK